MSALVKGPSHRRGDRLFLLIFTTALFFLLFSSPLAAGMLINVRAGEVFTVEDAVLPGHMLTFQFEFLDEASIIPVTVYLDGEKDKYWKTSKSGLTTVALPEFQANPEVEKKKQVMQVTIDNSNSHFTSVPVNFFFRSTYDFSHVGSEDLLDPLENKVGTLGMSLQRLEALQVSLRMEQKNHRATVESTNRRVLMWSIYQVIALFLVSFLNFLFFKRFLEKKSFF